MRILIETDGCSANSTIIINGEKQEFKEFGITVNKRLPNVKAQLIKVIEGRPIVMSFYAGDFKKYDEYIPDKENLK